MARSGYLSVRMNDKTKEIFDKFTTQKGFSKSQAMEEGLTIFMLSADEKLYNELLKDELDIKKSREILLERLLRSDYNDPMILRISDYSMNNNFLSEREIIEAHIRDLKTNGLGYTWLSTNALGKGISGKKVSFYNQLSAFGEEVTLLIAFVSDNQIHYAATVSEIRSSSKKLERPELGIPPEFDHEKVARIWLKLTDIRIETKITTSQLKVRSNDAELVPIFRDSQFLFGYVYKS